MMCFELASNNLLNADNLDAGLRQHAGGYALVAVSGRRALDEVRLGGPCREGHTHTVPATTLKFLGHILTGTDEPAVPLASRRTRYWETARDLRADLYDADLARLLLLQQPPHAAVYGHLTAVVTARDAA